jgi:hypothetical protein
MLLPLSVRTAVYSADKVPYTRSQGSGNHVFYVAFTGGCQQFMSAQSSERGMVCHGVEATPV